MLLSWLTTFRGLLRRRHHLEVEEARLLWALVPYSRIFMLHSYTRLVKYAWPFLVLFLRWNFRLVHKVTISAGKLMMFRQRLFLNGLKHYLIILLHRADEFTCLHFRSVFFINSTDCLSFLIWLILFDSKTLGWSTWRKSILLIYRRSNKGAKCWTQFIDHRVTLVKISS